MEIYNEDCITGAVKHFADESIDLIVTDPPFGLGEEKFGQFYNRDSSKVVDGYKPAPADYSLFTREWLQQAQRILKDSGSMYIISGWTNSDIIGSAIRELDLHLINKIIWQFSFGVYTKLKYHTSHYEIFYIKKRKNSKITFNTSCRENNTKSQYADMSSVWKINKENQPGKVKNCNKLPEALIEKMIQYSSNEGDTVCDFFLGNFTTATVANRLGRIPCGFEINKAAFDRYQQY